MRYLLDTHVFLWLDNAPHKLSSSVAAICTDPTHVLLLSVASVWEMQIKVMLGKLKLPAPLRDIVENQMNTNRVLPMTIELLHIWGVANLPSHHKDPFDRLLISQAIIEDIVLLSDDSKVAQYPVKVLW
jgi:PIN domain nuclease of toxin-antitoxin system